MAVRHVLCYVAEDSVAYHAPFLVSHSRALLIGGQGGNSAEARLVSALKV
jgi:hypothetical protein